MNSLYAHQMIQVDAGANTTSAENPEEIRTMSGVTFGPLRVEGDCYVATLTSANGRATYTISLPLEKAIRLSYPKGLQREFERQFREAMKVLGAA